MPKKFALTDLPELLASESDDQYKHFIARNIPNISADSILGVRVPVLKKAARLLERNDEAEKFFAKVPHKNFEENMIHALLIDRMVDYDKCIAAVDKFLPYIDNWSVCDILMPKAFNDHSETLEKKIPEWLHSSHPFTVRFGILTLIKFYMEDYFDPEHFQWVIDITNEDHYVRSAQAWYFAEALGKRYEQALPVLENDMLPAKLHNLVIFKAKDGRLLDDEKKAHLQSIRHNLRRGRRKKVVAPVEGEAETNA